MKSYKSPSTIIIEYQYSNTTLLHYNRTRKNDKFGCGYEFVVRFSSSDVDIGVLKCYTQAVKDGGIELIEGTENSSNKITKNTYQITELGYQTYLFETQL